MDAANMTVDQCGRVTLDFMRIIGVHNLPKWDKKQLQTKIYVQQLVAFQLFFDPEIIN